MILRQDKKLEQWSIKEERRINVFESHGALQLTEPRYSYTGNKVVSSSRDGTVLIWNAQTGALEFNQKLLDSVTMQLWLMSDDQLLIGCSVSTGRSAYRLWNMKIDTEYGIHTLREDVFSTEAALTKKGPLLIVHYSAAKGPLMSQDKIDVLRLPSFETIATIEVSDHLPGIAVSRDGEHVAVADNNVVRICESEGGLEAHSLEHDHKVYHVQYSADGNSIVTTGEDGVVRIWNSRTGLLSREIATEEKSLSLLGIGANGRVLAESVDNSNRLIAGELNNPANITLAGHGYGVLFAEFSPDGKKILTGGGDGAAVLWEATTGSLIRVIGSHEGAIRSACFGRDGKFILTAGEDKFVAMWPVGGGEPVYVWAAGVAPRATFSRDGTKLVTTSFHTANIVEVSTGKVLHTMQHDYVLDGAVFDSSGDKVITICPIGDDAFVWDVVTGDLVSRLHAQIVHASFSPNGKLVVTAGEDGMARLWNVHDGSQVFQLTGHMGAITGVEFSPDGTLIATSSDDCTARLWESRSGTMIHLLKGHIGEVNDISFSPDGKRLATAASDNTVRIWDVESGRQLSVLEGHKDRVWRARFSPDGSRLVTASLDKTARVYLVSVSELLAVGRLALPATLIPDYSDEVANSSHLVGQYNLNRSKVAKWLLAREAKKNSSIASNPQILERAESWAKDKAEEIAFDITIERSGAFSALVLIKDVTTERSQLTGKWRVEGKTITFEIREVNNRFDPGAGTIEGRLENGQLRIQWGDMECFLDKK